MKSQTELVARIIRENLPWEAVEASGTTVTKQPEKTLENLLRCHASQIVVRIVDAPVEPAPAISWPSYNPPTYEDGVRDGLSRAAQRPGEGDMGG